MQKYLQIAKISLSQEFAYRLNFVMWRLRNVMQVFLVFFLWSSVFAGPGKEIFGYDRDKILTYVFGILIIRAIVLSSRSFDIASEISQGGLVNHLLKPINFFNIWIARDLSSKALNLVFAIGETTVLYFILRPPFFLQTNIFIIVLFLISIFLAMVLFFQMFFITNMIAFWVPEATWATQFLFIYIFAEALSGAIFPLDILPSYLQQIVYTLPFPYLLFFPLQVYLNKLSLDAVISGLLVGGAWVFVLGFVSRYLWQSGLRQYSSYGK